MSTSCQALAERYHKEGNPAIPSSDAKWETKSDWLLTQEWGCIPPGTTEFKDAEYCKTYNNPPAPKNSNPSTANTRPPMLNYLKEDGFLHWVNQRGLQCINRIVGNFYGFNSQTGNANVPSVSVSPPQSQCYGACFQATSATEACFECINQTLLSNPSLCPQLNPNNPEDEQLIQDSVNCHECIGTKGGFVQKTGAAPNTPDFEKITNNVWACIVGTVHPPLTTAEIAGIVIIGVFVIAIAITLGIYYGVLHPRVLKSEKQRHQLMEKGINPDDL